MSGYFYVSLFLFTQAQLLACSHLFGYMNRDVVCVCVCVGDIKRESVPGLLTLCVRCLLIHSVCVWVCVCVSVCVSLLTLCLRCLLTHRECLLWVLWCVCVCVCVSVCVCACVCVCVC